MTPPTPAEQRRLLRIKSRLMRALRCEQPARLRAACVELASDIEAMLAGHPVADELCPSTRRSSSGSPGDTIPSPPPDFEIDIELESAPPVPVNRPSGGP